MLRISSFSRMITRLVVITLFVTLVFAAAGVSVKALAAPLAIPNLGPGLGEAGSYSVLGKAGVTNTGDSRLSGNVGADNPASITGFPPGTIGGSLVSAPAVNGAEADAQTAYLALTTSGPGSVVGPDLTGLTLHPGVYSVGNALLSGELTLDGAGTYIFLMSSGLTSSGDVTLINGASPCDVFWQVTSSAAIVAGSFVGTIIASTSITFGDGVRLDGRALALTGNVTLINNAISGPNCSGGSGSGAAHVSVTYECATDGRLAVTVGVSAGVSAGVTVSGLGADISSSVDTGDTGRIIRYLSPGHYEWQATPPSGRYMLDVDHGVIDVPNCSSAAVTAKTAITSTTAVTPKVAGLPKTGGAPLHGEDSPWALVLSTAIVGGMALVLIFQARRRHANLAR